LQKHLNKIASTASF